MELEQEVGRRLHVRFDSISNKDEFQSLVHALWIELGGDEEITVRNFCNICFELWCCFYNHLDISDKISRDTAEEKVRNLIKFTDQDQFSKPWEKGIYKTIASLVIGKNENLNLSIDNSEDFENMLKSWQSTGININPRKVVNTLARFTADSGFEEDTDVLERHSNIVGPYTTNHKMFGEYYNHSQKLWMKKLSKPEVKEKIIERSNRNRVAANDKSARDYQLAALFKKYYADNLVCVVCGTKGTTSQIEVSHKIPLSLGVDNFAFDSPINMELLCHPCHKRYEADFDKKYAKKANKEEFVESIYKSQLRNNPWAKFIKKDIFKIPDKKEFSFKGKVKCIDCRRIYNDVELCKKCNGAVKPADDPFFKTWKK